MTKFRVYQAWAMTVDASNEKEAKIFAYTQFKQDYPNVESFEASARVVKMGEAAAP